MKGRPLTAVMSFTATGRPGGQQGVNPQQHHNSSKDEWPTIRGAAYPKDVHCGMAAPLVTVDCNLLALRTFRESAAMLQGAAGLYDSS